IYTIEDLHTAYNKDFGGGYQQAGTTIEFLKNLIDELNKRGWAGFQGRSCGDPTKASPLQKFQPAQAEELSDYAFWIESMHFYLSVCFIFKLAGK
ncbi:MAG: hypothetical protein IMZ52_08850, partial [Actinobacteria bacterium]|nr:hypothetical protein [Actinomycetota bacterium]